MRKKLRRKAKRYTRAYHRRQTWKRIVYALACVVVFCTTYSMILPALTMEKITCGQEEHIHSESCYEKAVSNPAPVLTCTYESLGVHVHTELCKDSEGNLLCGQADFLLHVHNEDCVDGDGLPVCEIPAIWEHVHGDDCYKIPETEPAHEHGESCYAAGQGELTCEIPEGEDHAHTDSCYDQVSVLICQLEEGTDETVPEYTEETEPELVCGKAVIRLHTHDDNCYELYVDESGAEQKRLICGQTEVLQHVHSESCFTVAEVREDALTCTLPEDENHTHSELCYGTWTLICGKEEHTHDDACKSGGTAETLEEAETPEIEEIISVGEQIVPYSIALENVIGSGSEPNREGVEDAIHWKVTEDELGYRTITFSGTGGMKDYTYWNSAPWSEFRYKGMQTAIVEAGITYIGQNTLNHFSMSNLVIGPDVVEIGNNALTNNWGFGNGTLVIPGNVKKIGIDAFSQNSPIYSLVLEEGVEEIGKGAFRMQVPKVVLPNSLKSIQPRSFWDLVEEYVVSDDHPNFTVIDGVLYDKNVTTLISYPPYKLAEEYVVPSTVTTILKGALANVVRTAKLYIPANVKNLEANEAFAYSSYQEIVIEEGVGFTADTRGMFRGCIYLKELSLPDSFNCSLDYGYQRCDSLDTITIPIGTTFLNCLQGTPSTVNYNAKNCWISASRDYIFDVPGFDLNIGDTVDELQPLFGRISAYAGKILFKGPNTLVMEEGSFTGAEAPLDGLVGDYYVDSQGILYAYDKANEVAKVVYCPFNLTEATIPEAIVPDNGISYPVTTVGRNALKQAYTLKTLTFANIKTITTLETLALANCPTLTEVNGETTVEGAAALFAGANVGYNQFYNTGLTGASAPGAFDQDMDGDADLLVQETGAADLMITARMADGDLVWVDNGEGTGGYRVLTGQTVTIAAATGDTVEDQTKVYRVYFRATSEEAALSLKLGEEEAMSGWPFSGHATEDPYTFYIQFGAAPEGTTGDIPVNCSYPNIVSAGGGLTVWGVVVDSDEPKGTIIPSDNVMQISWTTRADDFAVTKTPESTGTIGVLGDGAGGAMPSANIGWTINFYRSTEETSPYGKDHATGAEFRDVFTLPEGIKWREDVEEAIANGTVRVIGKILYVGDTMVAKIEENSNMANNGLYMRARKMTLEDGKAVLSWGVSNSKTDSEMGTVYVYVTIYKEALRIDTSKESGFDPQAVATFNNEVYATVHYTYRKDAVYQNLETGEIENPQLYSCATRNISGGAGNIKMSYTIPLASKYFGEEIHYAIDVYNDGALPWQGETINGSTVYSVREMLPDEVYISPENMEKMFDERPELVITISNATLSPQWGTAVGVDGQTEVLLHQGNSDSIEASPADQTLTISVSDGIYTVAVAGGETHTGTSLAEILSSIGYTVTNTDTYTCTWPLNEEGELFELTGGSHRYFYVYATVKDTFQIIENDWREQYPSDNMGRIQPTAGLYTPENKRQLYNYVYSYSTRDFRIEKDVTRDGDALSDSYAANDGDVLDWCLTMSHYGNGSRTDLPLVDDIYGSQYLLVPQAGNENLEGLPTHGDCYILTRGNYTNVLVGVDDTGKKLIAASVDVEIADENSAVEIDGEVRTFAGMHTQIKWYLPKIDPGTYQMAVTYQTLVDHDLTGFSYTIGNLVRLNDREAHHLYDTVWGGGTLLSHFDKNIVVTEGSTPRADALDVDDYTAIGAGEAVTYRVELRNTLDTTIVMNGAKMADALPLSTEKELSWQKNVNILDFHVKTEGDVSFENLEEWYVGDAYGGLVGTRQYILWPESANITFRGPGTIYLYFTLVYPQNSETADLWDQYIDLANGDKVYNDFYIYHAHKGVSHDLKESGRVLLQKGVYGTYHYATSGDTGLKPSNSRLNFNNRDTRNRAAAYYVVIYNGANKRLYLNDLYDQLPEGFTFLRFIDGNGLNSYAPNSIMLKGGRNYLTAMTEEKVSYRSARISADTTDGLRFVISGGSGDYAIHYDAELEQYYLEKGEALEFGYVCDIGLAEQTGDVATNTIAMAYTDHLGTGVSVISKEEIYLTADGQEEYFSNENDGRRLLKKSQQVNPDSGTEEISDWLVSDVTLYRGSIVPGVTKYVDSYQDPSVQEKKPYVNQVFHNSIVNWRVRLHNSGTLAMNKYTLRDIVQYPYSFVGDVTVTRHGFDEYEESQISLITIPIHNPHEVQDLTLRDNIAGKDRVVTINGGEVPFGNANYAFYVSLSLDEYGNEVLTIRFESIGLGILEGGYMDISLSSVNDTGNYAYSVYTNQAVLEPTQDFTIVGQGSVVRNEQGDKVGAKNSASVTVTNGIVTTSMKTVAETAYPENKASDGNYIVLSDAESLFTYTLSVCNDTKNEMTKLVLLDNLPEVGDHNPFDVNTNRGSEFLVLLAENPAISVEIVPAGEKPYEPASYQVQYSTGTDFGGPQSVHWSGGTPDAGDPTQWTSDPSGARSIRVIINSPILDEATVVVKFTAKAGSDAYAGATAYNSFGYHYELLNQNYKLEAMSPVVGVRVPDIPTLSKRLVDSSGVAICAPEDQVFSFLVYEGAAIDGEFDTAQALIDAVTDAGRSFHEFTVTLEKGKTVSESIELSAEDWSWQAGETYTITELPAGERYSFRRYLNTAAVNYTFIHTPELSPEIVCENMLNLWMVRVRKVDQDGAPLAGARFALYSPDPADQLSGSISDAAPQILSDGRVLYLAEVATSDAEGLIQWDQLLRSHYYLLEIKAPDGYNLSDPNGQMLYRSSSEQNVLDTPVVNKMGYELPDTGGSGTSAYMKCALVLMATTVGLMCLQEQKRRKN